MQNRSFHCFMLIIVLSIGAFAQTTAFTYQGSLQSSGSPANGNYDFEFKLFDLVSGGAQQGSTLQRLNVAVANGGFTVSLDFGAGTLPGADRFLDIAVRTSGGGAFTALSPRQKVHSAPYSVKSLNSTTADSATNASQLGGVAANQYVVTTDPRMTDSRTPTAGSTNYIQNQDAVPQPSSNFNISGTGTANFINATTQFNLNNNRILSNAGTENLFVGIGAGQVNTGSFNSFFGIGAGQANTTSNGNSFFGRAAGVANTTGNENSFFGENAGLSNTTASGNSFFGVAAGQSNTTGDANAFFGYAAGVSNTTGFVNSFFGFDAGRFNTTGNTNSFFGQRAGWKNTTGSQNTFVGWTAGQENTDANNNSFFGYAAGQRNTSGTLNSFFGHAAGLFNTIGSGNSFFGQGAGQNNTTGSSNSFFGQASGITNTDGANNSFFGTAAGQFNTSGGGNSFVGRAAGNSNTTGNFNSFFGYNAGLQSATGSNNSFFGYAAGTNNASSNNSMFGWVAGAQNESGTNNSYFGSAAGQANSDGSNNSFFGREAGTSNAAGDNSFFGYRSGFANTTGTSNAFFGNLVGVNNTEGGSNSFFGSNAGGSNAIGNFNSFFGQAAGFNTTSARNTFIGTNAGVSNITGSSNTALGAQANFFSGNLQYATAIGADSTVSTSNTIALGRSNGSDQVVIPGNLVVNGVFNIPAGNPNYIQNTASLQASSNFNISGNGFVGGNLGVGTTNPLSKLSVQTSGYGFTQTNGTTVVGTYVNSSEGSFGTSSNHPLTFFTNGSAAQTTLTTGGNFGIGTTTPNTRLTLNGGPAWTSAGWTASMNMQNGSALGWEANSTGDRFGIGYTNGGLSFFRTASAFGNTASSANYLMTFADNGRVGIGTTSPSDSLQVNGGVMALGFNSPGNLLLTPASGSRIALRTAGSIERMTILDNGNVGIGVTNPTSMFQVGNNFSVESSGVIRTVLFGAGQAGHVCYSNLQQYLSVCQSAAEYAPSIDNGAGFPETADLVSIAPAVNNPYGDTHGPFTVEKSVTACDANLLGFIVNPESGANGPKLNDHYLPLAIYGYFPAKVTLENGPIKRGDPITSSSKAGFGMKATNACKIIGYALEDADEEGKIQVFSHLTEYSAPVVAKQQEQIEKQQTLIEKQQGMIEQLAKRLEQLEKKENK